MLRKRTHGTQGTDIIQKKDVCLDFFIGGRHPRGLSSREARRLVRGVNSSTESAHRPRDPRPTDSPTLRQAKFASAGVQIRDPGLGVTSA